MNDLVLDGYIKNFAEKGDLLHLDLAKSFEVFGASSILRRYHQSDITDIEDEVLVGGKGDGGLDAVVIMVNGRPVHTEKTVKFFVEKLRRLDVEFVFMQAKSSHGFKAADIGHFVFAVEQFFSAIINKKTSIEFNSNIKKLIDLTRHIYDQSINMQEMPKCFLYYVTAGKWTGATEPQGRLDNGVDRLRELNIFSDVFAKPVDAELLKVIYRELERKVERDVEFSRTAVFPIIDGVDDAYIGLLPGDEFIKLVSTEDDELNRELFYDNVRDYQGNNPVNSEINHTLTDEELRHNFPFLRCYCATSAIVHV